MPSRLCASSFTDRQRRASITGLLWVRTIREDKPFVCIFSSTSTIWNFNAGKQIIKYSASLFGNMFYIIFAVFFLTLSFPLQKRLLSTQNQNQLSRRQRQWSNWTQYVIMLQCTLIFTIARLKNAKVSSNRISSKYKNKYFYVLLMCILMLFGNVLCSLLTRKKKKKIM